MTLYDQTTSHVCSISNLHAKIYIKVAYLRWAAAYCEGICFFIYFTLHCKWCKWILKLPVNPFVVKQEIVCIKSNRLSVKLVVIMLTVLYVYTLYFSIKQM